MVQWSQFQFLSSQHIGVINRPIPFDFTSETVEDIEFEGGSKVGDALLTEM